MSKLTEDQKGNMVAKAIWQWLQNRKAVQFVPWVLDKNSGHYNPVKVAVQNERDKIYAELERVIRLAMPSEIQEKKTNKELCCKCKDAASILVASAMEDRCLCWKCYKEECESVPHWPVHTCISVKNLEKLTIR